MSLRVVVVIVTIENALIKRLVAASGLIACKYMSEQMKDDRYIDRYHLDARCKLYAEVFFAWGSDGI
jgi:hypothetical protein